MLKHTFTVIALALALAACGDKSDNQSGGAQNAKPPATNAPRTPEELGRVRFSACAACHSVKEGDNARIGPSLYGVYGRKAGAVDGFAYSPAMAQSDVVWTEESLDAYLDNPQSFIRGNRMAYAGEKNAETRAAIIAYMKTLGAAGD